MVDPRAFSRYDGHAATAAALDPAGLARVYSLLKPRLVEAYKELGHPDGDIDAAVEKAIVVLLQTPATDGTETLIPKVLSYKYENAQLEALLPAQKQLLRMGPDNVATVQNQLRAIARELGIPFDRLPAAKCRPAAGLSPADSVRISPWPAGSVQRPSAAVDRRSMPSMTRRQLIVTTGVRRAGRRSGRGPLFQDEQHR